MKTKEKYLTLSIMLILFSCLESSAQNLQEKKKQFGLYYSIGASSLWGNGTSDYNKNKQNVWMEFGPFLNLPISVKNSIKTELSFGLVSSDYIFESGEPGIAKQNFQKLNFKFCHNFSSNNDTKTEIAFGPSIYTLNQIRIPYHTSLGESTIKDGYFSYVGSSIDADITFSFPFGKGIAGLQIRSFYQLPFTVYSKSNIPKFYNCGFSVGWLISY